MAANTADADAMAPTLPPELAASARQRSTAEILADLNKSPLFMTDLEENDDVAALQALAYEGTPLENGQAFKERGNECFKERKWADAREFYSKGIEVLVLEERKRAKEMKDGMAHGTAQDRDAGVEAVANEQTETAKAEEQHQNNGSSDPEATVREERAILEALYVNRAAAQLELKNYRSCWLDCAAALRLNPSNVKAFYRSAKALLSVDRLTEADDACARGLELDPANTALHAVARDIIARSTALSDKAKRADERAARTKRRALLVRAALAARQVRLRASVAKPPDVGDAVIQLVPDPDKPTSALAFPVVLLYPVDGQSDFIKAFDERSTLQEHFGYILPPPWDEHREYVAAGVDTYVETARGGLLKVGNRVRLIEVLSGGNVEVVDGLVRMYVVPKPKAKAWVKEFKKAKAAEMGQK